LATTCSRVRFSGLHANKIDENDVDHAAREISCGARLVRDNGGRFPSMRPSSSLAALVLVVSVATAHAGPHAKLATREPTNKDALAHLQLGNRALNVNDYDRAIKEYQQGAILDPVPLFWFNLGLAYRNSQRFPEAIKAFREFVRRSAGDDDPDGYRAQVEQLLPQLVASQTAPPQHPQPSTETSGVEPNAPTGEGEPASTSSKVATAPLASATITASPAVPSAGSGAPAASATTAGATPTWSRWHDGLGWGLTGAGVLAAGVGVGLLASASSLDGQADRETDFAKRDQLRQSASSRRSAGEITAAAGAVLLVGAIARFALIGSPAQPSSISSLQLTPGPGDVGLGFAIGF
jgi:tetratricopeptide (TPR) repeat protein